MAIIYSYNNNFNTIYHLYIKTRFFNNTIITEILHH